MQGGLYCIIACCVIYLRLKAAITYFLTYLQPFITGDYKVNTKSFPSGLDAVRGAAIMSRRYVMYVLFPVNAYSRI